jgi:hypothetical protein
VVKCCSAEWAGVCAREPGAQAGVAEVVFAIWMSYLVKGDLVGILLLADGAVLVTLITACGARSFDVAPDELFDIGGWWRLVN